MDSRVATVLAFVEKQPDIDIEAVSASVNLSPSRLRHLFRAETRMPLYQYVKRCRLQRAEHLLATTFLSVKQVCDASGFGDTCHFVRVFHKTFGEPPSAHRRRLATSDNK
jgi:transcriptional regulator GlxA family with amidase domain